MFTRSPIMMLPISELFLAASVMAGGAGGGSFSADCVAMPVPAARRVRRSGQQHPIPSGCSLALAIRASHLHDSGVMLRPGGFSTRHVDGPPIRPPPR